MPSGLVGDQRREHQQRHAVGERGEDLDAAQAERQRSPGGSLREREREQRQGDRHGVGEHVRSVGEQRERVRDHRRRQLAGHEREDQAEHAGELSPVSAGG